MKVTESSEFYGGVEGIEARLRSLMTEIEDARSTYVVYLDGEFGLDSISQEARDDLDGMLDAAGKVEDACNALRRVLGWR